MLGKNDEGPCVSRKNAESPMCLDRRHHTPAYFCYCFQLMLRFYREQVHVIVENNNGIMSSASTKKRKKDGRISDATKKLRLQCNVTGSDCKCKTLKCFSIISEQSRGVILREFNSLSSYNEQNSHLAGLISLVPVQRRRPRKPQNEITRFNQSSYKYRVRVLNEEGATCDVPICYKAFLSIHGVSGRHNSKFIKNGRLSSS